MSIIRYVLRILGLRREPSVTVFIDAVDQATSRLDQFKARLEWLGILIRGGIPVHAAFFDSSKSKFLFDQSAGGAPVDMSAFVTEVTGLPGPRTLSEVTAINDGGSKFHPSIESVTFSVRGVYDDSAAGSGGPEAVFGVHRTATQTASFDFRPEGSTTGMPAYTGECWVENFEIGTRVGSHVDYTVSCRVDGVVTRGTVA